MMVTASSELVHGVAVAVAVDPDGPLAGALLLGPSGSGKSALALALIAQCPWRRTALIADDAVYLAACEGALWARAPARIEGLIELRGYGPISVRTAPFSPLLAGFDLAATAARLPEPDWRRMIDGAATLPVWPFAGAAGGAMRIRLILRSVLSRQTFDPAHDSDDSKTS